MNSDLSNWKCGGACDKIAGVVSVSKFMYSPLGVFGYVGYNTKENQIVAAFRGSANIENWIMNIDFKKSNYKSLSSTIQVHTGFYDSYTVVASQVINKIAALSKAHPSATILFTGHSLGGALATFAAVDFKEKGISPNTMYVYTYGSPRTGNQAWADYV